MTSRERFLRTLSYRDVDRPPLFDDGLREDVLERWSNEGLPQGTDLDSLFAIDRREEIQPNLHPAKSFSPLSEPGQLDRFEEFFVSDGRQPEDWSQRVEELNDRSWTAGLVVWRGLLQMLGIGDWTTLVDVLTGIKTQPEVAECALGKITDVILETIEPMLRQVRFDYVVFSEPIAGSDGTVVSPEMYRHFCVHHCRRLSELAKRCGVSVIVFRSWGRSTSLLPAAMDAGMNAFWCGETGLAGVDYSRLRRQHGRRLRLIGGVDVHSLVESEKKTGRALGDLLPELLADGGYIPLADGRIRAEVGFSAYSHYRQQLEKLCNAGKK